LYCFAEQYMEGAPGHELRWDDYIYVLDFYERNGEPKVSLLGGEPTTHPYVADMADYAMQRGFDVRVFTSGIMSDRQRERLAAVWNKHDKDVPRHTINFIVNLNHPSETSEAQAKSQAAFMALAGKRASISFNIHRPDFDLNFAFDAIEQHKLEPTIRLGLTHPIAGAGRQAAFLHPKNYRAVAASLERVFPRFQAGAVIPGFDCGFPPCMFTDEQLGKLVKLRARFTWTCGPVIDIGPDLELWPCFPLTEVRGKSLYDFDSIRAIQEYFHKEVRGQRLRKGAYPECAGCTHLERQMCSGGCQSYAVNEVPIEEGSTGAGARDRALG
jgi:radical SAM protein with 4Fe4S-binding SPASM domain